MPMAFAYERRKPRTNTSPGRSSKRSASTGASDLFERQAADLALVPEPRTDRERRIELGQRTHRRRGNDAARTGRVPPCEMRAVVTPVGHIATAEQLLGPPGVPHAPNRVNG